MDDRVTGIGGIFFKARDKARLLAWYRDHLGVDVQFEPVAIPGFAADGSLRRHAHHHIVEEADPEVQRLEAHPLIVAVDAA